MATTMTKTAPTYLREARIAAGYANRDVASTGVPYSPETIGRHERGDVPIAPQDAMVYARSYGRDDILIRYCADCPVGRAQGIRITDLDLPFATLRLTQRLRKAAKDVAPTLEEIADGGSITAQNRPAFDAALAALKELGDAISDITLYAVTRKIEKAPAVPKGTGRGPSCKGYSITNAPPSQAQILIGGARS